MGRSLLVGLEGTERLDNVSTVTQEVGELQVEPWVVWLRNPGANFLDHKEEIEICKAPEIIFQDFSIRKVQ